MEEKHLIHSQAHRRAEEARAESAANLQAMSVILEAKSRIIGQVFQEAHQAMAKMPREKYRQALKALLQEAARELGGGMTVRSSREDLKTVQELVKEAGLKAEVQADPQVADGIVVSDQAGRSTVLNRFSDRLERARPGLMARVSEILWG
jgi:vacuolar-type H+-ATPase subunit E/Vma4